MAIFVVIQSISLLFGVNSAPLTLFSGGKALAKGGQRLPDGLDVTRSSSHLLDGLSQFTKRSGFKRNDDLP